ncbi:hypothetical protein [Bacillus cereus]|uniref:hypothetical protein n=1 Tax=Bacillus cereus TaxID=1396 RepID=UPI001E534989|nr:hypothetical protein [Bacillus cereus]
MYTVTFHTHRLTHGGLALHYKEILGAASHIIYMHCIPANQFKRLVYGENQKHDRNILEDSERSLLDGLYKQLEMTKEEETAFLYQKENVLDEMATELEK